MEGKDQEREPFSSSGVLGWGGCDSSGMLAAIFVADMLAGRFTEQSQLFFFFGAVTVGREK